MSAEQTGDPTDNEKRRIVMHVNFAEAERLKFVLNNVENIFDYYDNQSVEVEIRIVCHGPGLHLLRIDTSPVSNRLVQMIDKLDDFKLYACTNTIERMTKAEGKKPEIVKQAILVPAGLPEIIELQRKGWIYLKP